MCRFGCKNRLRYTRCDAMRIPDCLQKPEGAGRAPPFTMNENGVTQKWKEKISYNSQDDMTASWSYSWQAARRHTSYRKSQNMSKRSYSDWANNKDTKVQYWIRNMRLWDKYQTDSARGMQKIPKTSEWGNLPFTHGGKRKRAGERRGIAEVQKCGLDKTAGAKY